MRYDKERRCSDFDSRASHVCGLHLLTASCVMTIDVHVKLLGVHGDDLCAVNATWCVVRVGL